VIGPLRVTCVTSQQHLVHQGACTWAYARSPVAQDEQIAGEAHEIDFISKKKSERDSWGSAFELRRLRRKSSRSGIDLARTGSNCYRCVVHGTEKVCHFTVLSVRIRMHVPAGACT